MEGDRDGTASLSEILHLVVLSVSCLIPYERVSSWLVRFDLGTPLARNFFHGSRVGVS